MTDEEFVKQQHELLQAVLSNPQSPLSPEERRNWQRKVDSGSGIMSTPRYWVCGMHAEFLAKVEGVHYFRFDRTSGEWNRSERAFDEIVQGWASPVHASYAQGMTAAMGFPNAVTL